MREGDNSEDGEREERFENKTYGVFLLFGISWDFIHPRGLVCPASVLLLPVFTPVAVLPGAGCTLYPSLVVLSIIGFDSIFNSYNNQRQRNYFLF